MQCQCLFQNLKNCTIINRVPSRKKYRLRKIQISFVQETVYSSSWIEILQCLKKLFFLCKLIQFPDSCNQYIKDYERKQLYLFLICKIILQRPLAAIVLRRLSFHDVCKKHSLKGFRQFFVTFIYTYFFLFAYTNAEL